jgi:hypothetical protein
MPITVPPSSPTPSSPFSTALLLARESQSIWTRSRGLGQNCFESQDQMWQQAKMSNATAVEYGCYFARRDTLGLAIILPLERLMHRGPSEPKSHLLVGMTL